MEAGAAVAPPPKLNPPGAGDALAPAAAPKAKPGVVAAAVGAAVVLGVPKLKPPVPPPAPPPNVKDMVGLSENISFRYRCYIVVLESECGISSYYGIFWVVV